VTSERDVRRRTRTGRSAGGRSRRNFLTVALSLLAGVPSASGATKLLATKRRGQAVELPTTLVDLQALLGSYFEQGDIAHVRTLGRRYLERFGGDQRALADDLARAVRLVADSGGIDEAVAILAAAVTRDFATDERTSLGGWQLARTEARLCALVESLASARR